MIDSCFVENQFQGLGSIILLATSEFTLDGNYLEPSPDNNPLLSCQLAAYYESAIDALSQSMQCVNATSSKCAVENSASQTNNTNSLSIQRFVSVMNDLLIRQGEALEIDVNDTQTPAYHAALWMSQDDKWEQMTTDKIFQRFALGCVYFALSGDSSWAQCGRESRSCLGVPWLNPSDECTWSFVTCTDDEVVNGLVFRKEKNNRKSNVDCVCRSKNSQYSSSLTYPQLRKGMNSLGVGHPKCFF